MSLLSDNINFYSKQYAMEDLYESGDASEGPSFIGGKPESPGFNFKPVYTFIVVLKNSQSREFKAESLKFLDNGTLLLKGSYQDQNVYAAFADGEWLSVERKEEPDDGVSVL